MQLKGTRRAITYQNEFRVALADSSRMCADRGERWPDAECLRGIFASSPTNGCHREVFSVSNLVVPRPGSRCPLHGSSQLLAAPGTSIGSSKFAEQSIHLIADNEYDTRTNTLSSYYIVNKFGRHV